MRYFIFKSLLYTFFLALNLYIAAEFSYLFIEYPEHHSFGQYLWQMPAYFIFYFYYKLMTRRMVTSSEFILMQKANLFALVIIVSIIFVSKTSDDYSRAIILVYFLLNVLSPIWVYLIKREVMKNDFFRKDIFVVSDADGYKNIEKWFTHDNAFGFDVKEVLMVDTLSHQEMKDAIDRCIESGEYHAAVIALDKVGRSRTFYYIDHIQHHISRVIVLPKLTRMPLFNAEIFNSINHKGMAFFVKNNLLNPVDRLLKVIFDTIMTAILILLFSPILMSLYILVYISTKGHPIYKQRRIGHNGRAFKIYKFRSMRMDADQVLEELLENDPDAKVEWEKEFKLKDDPRITKIGAFLRKTSLDELPQLINVLNSQMSLVGPRPIVKAEIEKYGDYFDYFKAVKPGITGLWQISGRNDIDYDERVQLDVWYTRNWSVELDIVILLKTAVVVLSRKGSY